MTHEELEERNITPRGAFDDAYAATKHMERERKQAQDKIKTKYSNRPLPQEIIERGVINQNEFIKVYNLHTKKTQKTKKKVVFFLTFSAQFRTLIYKKRN